MLKIRKQLEGRAQEPAQSPPRVSSLASCSQTRSESLGKACPPPAAFPGASLWGGNPQSCLRPCGRAGELLTGRMESPGPRTPLRIPAGRAPSTGKPSTPAAPHGLARAPTPPPSEAMLSHTLRKRSRGAVPAPRHIWALRRWRVSAPPLGFRDPTLPRVPHLHHRARLPSVAVSLGLSPPQRPRWLSLERSPPARPQRLGASPAPPMLPDLA